MEYKYFDYKLKGFSPKDRYGDCVAYSTEEIAQVFAQIKTGYILDANEDHTYKLIKINEDEIVKHKTQSRIAELKSNLSATDYQAIKFAEGELLAEDYAEMKAQRAEWRKEINELEVVLNNLQEGANE